MAVTSNTENYCTQELKKMVRLFKETYYYPDYLNLMQNIINECKVCNQAETEHRKTSLLLKATPETEFCRKTTSPIFTRSKIKIT